VDGLATANARDASAWGASHRRIPHFDHPLVIDFFTMQKYWQGGLSLGSLN
jgi:hypothetical protein